MLASATGQAVTGNELPKWITPDSNAWDQKGAVAIERGCTTDRPVTLSLQELAESRQAEVRTLAARCSGYVGQFDPFIAALNDGDQRSTDWPKHIEALRGAGPRTRDRGAGPAGF